MKNHIVLSLVIVVSVMSGCKDQAVNPLAQPTGVVAFSFGKPPVSIAEIVARLSREGYDDRVLTLIVADTGMSASGFVTDIAVGRWHLKVDAMDDSGHVKFTGETDVDVVPDQLTRVSLELSATTGDVDIVVTWGASCALAPSALVSWWPADHTAKDIIGYNDGVPMNGLTYTAGKVVDAFRFDGTDQFVRVPTSATLNPEGSFSIDAWIYPTTDARGVLVAKWGDDGFWYNQRAFILEKHTEGRLSWAVSDSAHQQDMNFHVFYSPTGVVSLNTWNHVAVVYDQSVGTRRVYVNGKKVAQRNDQPIRVLKSIADLTIGGRLASPTALEFPFTGKIDEVDFYAKALDDEEIKSIHIAGSIGKCR